MAPPSSSKDDNKREINPPQHQSDQPGHESKMHPAPDFLPRRALGKPRLEGRVALITGGDSGIGRAVAVLFAREGADVAVAYLTESSDAQETQEHVQREGRRCILLPGDIRCLRLMGVQTIYAIDRESERLALARSGGARTINFELEDVYDALYDLTGGRGPDACLDAVGMEAHGLGAMGVVDSIKQTIGIENDRPHVLRQMIKCCRKGGNVSILGVYSGLVDSLPMGVAFNKGLTFRMSQVHLHRYKELLLEHILTGRLDPSEIISHVMPLSRAAEGYEMFNDKANGCTKIVLKPGAEAEAVIGN